MCLYREMFEKLGATLLTDLSDKTRLKYNQKNYLASFFMSLTFEKWIVFHLIAFSAPQK